MNLSMRRLTAVIAAVCATAGTAVVLSTAPASASPACPTGGSFPQCFGRPFQVSTPDNTLYEWTTNPLQGGTTLKGTLTNGTTLWVECQANNGAQEDGEYNVYPTVPSKTWDYVWDPGNQRFAWVYDWWMSTPHQNAADNWYSWAEYQNPNGTESYCNFPS